MNQEPATRGVTTMNSMIQTRSVGHVRWIGFNRPDKLNALTIGMYEDLARSLGEADQDQTIRVVLLHGVPGCFTAGNDIRDFMERPPSDGDSAAYQFLLRLSQFSKPIVAAVSGHAIGIGTTLLLHCDFVVADATARFRLPFVDLGLCPEGGSSLLLPGIVGFRLATEMLMLGTELDAGEALASGLVSRVTSTETLTDEAATVAQALCSKPPKALRATRHLMKVAQADAVQETIQREANEFATRLRSSEAREALEKFAAGASTPLAGG